MNIVLCMVSPRGSKHQVGSTIADDTWWLTEFEWEFYTLSASEAIFRARTYNCIIYSVR